MEQKYTYYNHNIKITTVHSSILKQYCEIMIDDSVKL